MKKFLYADESGNLDFRDHTAFNGPTRYYAVGSLLIEGEDRKDALEQEIRDLRMRHVKAGVEHDGHFHATTDSTDVRRDMFTLLARHEFKVDVTLLEKAKAIPRVRVSDAYFHQTATFYHFRHFASRYFRAGDELTMVSAGLGTKKTRKAFSAAVTNVVKQCCPSGVSYDLAFWNAATTEGLQAVDYVLWSVMREQERGEKWARKLMEDKIHSVYDLWKIGTQYHYGPHANVPVLTR